MDGDDPAAMRYTEARMSKIAVEMLRDLEKIQLIWLITMMVKKRTYSSTITISKLNCKWFFWYCGRYGNQRCAT